MSRVLGVVAGAGYALVVAATTPFTRDADIAVALPLVALAVMVSLRWPWHTGRIRLPRPERGHPYLPWLLLFGAETIWELFNYVAPGRRAEHPTFSSMTDAVDRTYLLKALVVLAWLSLGWLMVRKGSKAT
jgi:hypothetical protein